MLVLGISDLEHDTAAALLNERGLVAAVEEDKLSRTVPGAGLPRLGVAHCLRETSAENADLSAVALATRPKRAWLRAEAARLHLPGSRPGESAGRNGSDGVLWKLGQLQLLRRELGAGIPLLQFEHHLCHAASAFYPSGFDRALVLTLDQSGDMWSGLIAVGEGTDLYVLRPIRFPHSLGWFYSQVTELVGFRPGHDEHKVQWLSKEGSPEFVDVFRRQFSTSSDDIPVLSPRRFGNGNGNHSGFLAELKRDLHLADSASPCEGALRAAIARSAQDFLEETVVKLADTYRRKTGAKHLCVAGGVFLNVLLIRALERQAGFDKVFVQPVSGNAGSALGAAYLARKHMNGNGSREGLAHLYLGPGFGEEEIKAVLDNCKAIYRYLPSDKQLLDETVRLLREDKVVAWYQGRLEFGHRALGNRSILASPFSPYVTENLNQYVKHREDFHPFALSVPVENASDIFDCTDNCRFMSSIGTLKDASHELDRFAFNLRSIRIHTVEKQVNPRFWALLHTFGKDAPAPVLVNTSFNLFGEPLVCDPREAVRSFFCSGIDALVMGNFLVVKP